jgi:hypothetical protein
MKVRVAIPVIALHLLILSSLFVPLSHASWSQFAKEFLIRLAITAAFATVASLFLDAGAAEPYRITDAPQPSPIGDIPAVELQDSSASLQTQISPKPRRRFLAFWVVILALFCVTQTSWWEHQLWLGSLFDTAFRWTVSLFCWGCLVLLWMPKPDANQPEKLHVVPTGNSNDDTSPVSRSVR